MPKFETITGPAFIANYLINNDASGITPDILPAIDVWIARQGIKNVVDAGAPYFTRSWFMYCPEWCSIEPDVTAGTVIDYICEVSK